MAHRNRAQHVAEDVAEDVADKVEGLVTLLLATINASLYSVSLTCLSLGYYLAIKSTCALIRLNVRSIAE